MKLITLWKEIIWMDWIWTIPAVHDNLLDSEFIIYFIPFATFPKAGVCFNLYPETSGWVKLILEIFKSYCNTPFWHVHIRVFNFWHFWESREQLKKNMLLITLAFPARDIFTSNAHHQSPAKVWRIGLFINFKKCVVDIHIIDINFRYRKIKAIWTVHF